MNDKMRLKPHIITTLTHPRPSYYLQPAVNKINLLPRVEAVVAVKALQGTLLDFDILGVFADWICVKKDKSLPSHTVRTSVYKMLNDLPCQSDHLKRRNEGAAHTIGMVIMSLYKHKEETKENKRFLKTIIEKWSRPIYNKTSDVRSANLVGNVELQQAQYLHIDQHVRERELADAASQVHVK